MTTTLSTPTDNIVLPPLNDADEVVKFQEALIALKQELPAPEATPAYRAAVARKKLLNRLLMAAATGTATLSFERVGRFLLTGIFPNQDLATASSIIIDNWVEAIRTQWMLIRDWVKNGHKGSLPAIAE